MCGISGIFQNSVSFDPKVLHSMVDALRHRGPDGANTWTDTNSGIGFGHNRLAIIDTTDTGIQPMHLFDRYVITYNGEIYNFNTLKENLIQGGNQFHTQSDTEVILLLYHLHGPQCLNHLDGMFAFAIYDKLHQKLFCARDRFGEKPFYYHFQKDRFVFASEMKALWLAGIKKVVSEKAIYNYLALNRCDIETPFYEGIHEIPPGNYVEITKLPSGLTLNTQQYYDAHNAQTSAYSSAHLRELIETSVKERCISDVGFVLSLSGGIDSSITSLIASMAYTNVESYGVTYPGRPYNEAGKQDLVSQKLKTSHTHLPYHEHISIHEFEAIVRHHELPLIHKSSFAQNFLYKRIREHGHKVVLEGQGADEIFGGYGYQQRAYISNLWHQGSVASAAFQLLSLIGSGPRSAISSFKKFGKLGAGLNKEFAKNFEQEKDAVSSDDFANGNLARLLKYADINSMMYGLEVRLPFLKYSLVEYGLGIGEAIKYKHGYRKWPLRNAFNGDLPQDVLWNTEKIGFNTALRMDGFEDVLISNAQANIYFENAIPESEDLRFKKAVLSLLLS